MKRLVTMMMLRLAAGLRLLTNEYGGQAEVLISSLSEPDEFTICARFLTLDFKPFPGSNYHHVMTHWGEKSILAAFIAMPCDQRHSGCSEYYKEKMAQSGAVWRNKKVFGYSDLGGDRPAYFPVWETGVWNSVCVVASRSRGVMEVRLNGDLVARSDKYEGFHHRDSNIMLMNPSHGSITDLQIWGRSLSSKEQEDWALCRRRLPGDLLDWEEAKLQVTSMNISELRERNETCFRKREDVYLGFSSKKNFDDMKKFCRDIGGNIAVGKDQKTLEEIREAFDCESSVDWFYSGLTDLDDDRRWEEDGTGEEVVVGGQWAPGQPQDGRPKYDCAVYNTSTGLLASSLCSQLSCPVCHLPTSHHAVFVLRGVCLNSSVDSHFVMKSSREFLGYIGTKMVYSQARERWEILERTGTGPVLAFMEPHHHNFPLGLRRWRFLDTNCSDHQDEARSLLLHRDVEQPGEFCCDDGTCLDSLLVCNNFPDCQDGSDEANCTFLHVSKYQRDTERPPVELRDGKILPLILNVTFNAVQLFEINEADFRFDLYFIIEIQWFDRTLNFEFLKLEDRENYLYESSKSKIWTPTLEESDVVDVVKSRLDEVMVLRRGRPSLDADLDYIRPNEVYIGRENPLQMIVERRMLFSCSFDNIKNYPFGSQRCSLKIHFAGEGNHLTRVNMRGVKYQGRAVVGQYVVQSWENEEEFNDQTDRRSILITMVLKRNITSVFLVTFLPTILINLINQATNYMTVTDRYSLIITVNITCMMVLASIYLSVSSSLPTTSDIKPIEVWLLFNLAYPFITILVNVVLQVRIVFKHNKYEPFRDWRET